MEESCDKKRQSKRKLGKNKQKGQRESKPKSKGKTKRRSKEERSYGRSYEDKRLSLILHCFCSLFLQKEQGLGTTEQGEGREGLWESPWPSPPHEPGPKVHQGHSGCGLNAFGERGSRSCQIPAGLGRDTPHAYFQVSPQVFPALIPSPRGLASVARQFRSITDSVLSPSEGPSLPSLWAPSCIRHIPGYPGVLLVACGAQLHFWHFRKFREQRTEAYNHGLGLATWGCLGLFGREPHPASPWGPGEDLAWRSLPRRTSLVFSSFQITEKRLSDGWENITQHNPGHL